MDTTNIQRTIIELAKQIDETYSRSYADYIIGDQWGFVLGEKNNVERIKAKYGCKRVRFVSTFKD